MSRARNLKPGFFKNEELAECSPWARLCFAGLWTLADREGRLEDRPKRIKAELFAFDSIEVEPLLAELDAHGFLVRYRNSDGSFIQISRFLAHQKPHYSEKDSVIKPPKNQEPRLHDEGAKPGELRRTPENSGNDPPLRGGRNALNPSCLNPESLSPLPPASGGGSFGFEKFWEAYPRKVGKDAARRAFAKRKPDESLLCGMLRAIAEQGKSESWRKDEGQFIPHPATWLNAGRWEDEATSLPSAPPVDVWRPEPKLSAEEKAVQRELALRALKRVRAAA